MHIVGTAGHVDHGKLRLAEALTGIDPDRLPEERARSMTIDLGFAWLRLPGRQDSVEQEISIVDVPVTKGLSAACLQARDVLTPSSWWWQPTTA